MKSDRSPLTDRQATAIAVAIVIIGLVLLIRYLGSCWDATVSPQPDQHYDHTAPGAAPAQPHRQGARDSQTELARMARRLITPDVYPEIAWWVVRGDDVFLGFRRWRGDGPAVVLALARQADTVVRAVEGHIAGNATVWAVRADADRRDLPGEHCYYWAITDEGWIDTSDGRRHPPLD